MRLQQVDADQVHRIVAGDFGDLLPARGWPHSDTAAGLSFVDSGGTPFLIVDDDGLVIGECGTKLPPGADGVVEIGYGLAAPSRGNGNGKQLVGLLLERLATEPAVRTIEAEVHVDNGPSRGVLLHHGFALHQPEVGGFERYRRTVSS